MLGPVIINCDGGARGNPGPAASAFVVRRNEIIIYKHSEYLGIATNNVAEYRGVIAGLRWINQTDGFEEDKEIIFYLDSELVIKQLLGIFKTKNQTLRQLLETAKILQQNSQMKIIYKLIPREKNTEADLLVNETLNKNKY